MESVMTVLTDEQEAIVWAIGITGMPTHRASFARIVCVNLNCHRTIYESFVGNHALQLSKRPFGIGCISLPLLPADFLAVLVSFASRGSLANICQLFQADQAVGVSGHNALGDHMIGVGFQPSLSSADHHQATGGGSSAFVLQTLSQSRIMVGFRDNTLPCVERTLSPSIAGHC